VRRDGERLRYVFDAGVHDVSGLGLRGPVTNLLRRLEIGDRLEWRRMGHEYILPDLRLKVPHGYAEVKTGPGIRRRDKGGFAGRR